ncbi:hypothetical protein ABTM67_20310, partial [Acinetobacter baumannii]
MAVSISLLFAGVALAAETGNWREYNGDKAGARYEPGAKVTKDSVKSMKVAWRVPLPGNQISADNPDLRTWVNE